MKLVYQDRVPIQDRDAFVAKVRQISALLGINPNWLMAIMFFESAGTFSPSIVSHKTGASGLIQFMPSTAIKLGTTVEELRKMSAVSQLDYVYKYYKPYAMKIKNYIDTYFVTFFPLAVGKPDDFIIQSNSLPAGLIARQNPAFDTDRDSKIYVWEVKKIMLSKLPSEWVHNIDPILFYKSYKPLIIGTGVIVIGISALLYGKFSGQKAAA